MKCSFCLKEPEKSDKNIKGLLYKGTLDNHIEVCICENCRRKFIDKINNNNMSKIIFKLLGKESELIKFLTEDLK